MTSRWYVDIDHAVSSLVNATRVAMHNMPTASTTSTAASSSHSLTSPVRLCARRRRLVLLVTTRASQQAARCLEVLSTASHAHAVLASDRGAELSENAANAVTALIAACHQCFALGDKADDDVDALLQIGDAKQRASVLRQNSARQLLVRRWFLLFVVVALYIMTTDRPTRRRCR